MSNSHLVTPSFWCLGSLVAALALSACPLIAAEPAMTADLTLAPPPVDVDGLHAVPVDLSKVTATIVIDAAKGSGRVAATMDFALGEQAGNPIFDLRQEIMEAKLDGLPLKPAELSHHDLGGGPDAKLRVIARRLEARSTHTLELAYDLRAPQSAKAESALAFDTAGKRVTWDFFFTDLVPGRYLEMWLPANLIYDRFALDLDLEIVGTAVPHVAITNGAIQAAGSEPAANHWRIVFPDRFTALSPLLVLIPADGVEHRSGSMTLPGGATLALEAWKAKAITADLAGLEAQLRALITADVANIGPYIHGERFTAWIWDSSRSMEYDGAVESSLHAFEHEVFHSWYGRGIKPASQNDGWIDEAWNVYCTGGAPPDRAFGNGPAVTECSADPYNRITPQSAYGAGALFFSGLAHEIGVQPLRAAMAAFYVAHRGDRITTRQLEDHLQQAAGSVDVRARFAKWVYGKE